jgi:hypothetical protein
MSFTDRQCLCTSVDLFVVESAEARSLVRLHFDPRRYWRGTRVWLGSLGCLAYRSQSSRTKLLEFKGRRGPASYVSQKIPGMTPVHRQRNLGFKIPLTELVSLTGSRLFR